jgi:ubiquinone/menaquinone biosynthesis C-methylase UbiE
MMSQAEQLKLFFEIHQGLPREGSGNFVSSRRAFTMLTDLPWRPIILDLGCGPGMQTLHLSRLTEGDIVAVDNHQPYLDQLSQRALVEGVAERVRVVNADMTALEFDRGTFDLIWAEGSAYIMGFEEALLSWRPFLKRRGYLAVTEVSWLRPTLPDELRFFWEGEYPQIQNTGENVMACQGAGYTVLGQFVLPESAWWGAYYFPLGRRLQALELKYQNDPERLQYLEDAKEEINLYRRYSDFYGYVFYVMQVDVI